MSSVYGPALLKPASFEENTEFAGGKSKANRDNGTDFETDADRAKRIRKERKALKQKDKETSLKSSMGQAISGVLGGGGSNAGPFVSFGAAPAGPAPPPSSSSAGASIGPMRPAPGPSVPEGVKIGGGSHTPSESSQPVAEASATAAPATAAGPSTGPAGPAASAPIGNGKTQDPSGASEGAGVEDPAGGSTGAVPRPRGPAKPPPEALPRPTPRDGPKAEEASQQAEALLPMDHLATQKRVSWDELKERLANADLKQEGVPGSKSFDDYSEKLEKSRNERLQRQEIDTKKLLRSSAKLSEKKMKKVAKKMKEKGGDRPKRTADGAILAVSDGDTSEEDALLARYKNQKKAAKTSVGS